MKVMFKIEGLSINLPALDGGIALDGLEINTEMTEAEFQNYIYTLTNMIKQLGA
jgi:hypothetical protein